MRQNWKFQYPAREVADAAAAKRANHADRLAWWEQKQRELIAEVREKGLEVEESLAAVYSSSAAPHGARLVVKDDYQTKLNECYSKIKAHAKLNECHSKIKAHGAKVREYDGWVQFLRNRTDAVDLDCDDYLFFYGE